MMTKNAKVGTISAALEVCDEFGARVRDCGRGASDRDFADSSFALPSPSPSLHPLSFHVLQLIFTAL